MTPLLISAFLQWSMANPTAIQDAAAAATKTRKVDTSQFQSFADMSQQILKCYHPTARFQSADMLESPWTRQAQYNATKSSLLEIRFAGISNAKYSMRVGLLEKDGQVKATVIQENTVARASAKCALENWTSTKK